MTVSGRRPGADSKIARGSVRVLDGARARRGMQPLLQQAWFAIENAVLFTH